MSYKDANHRGPHQTQRETGSTYRIKFETHRNMTVTSTPIIRCAPTLTSNLSHQRITGTNTAKGFDSASLSFQTTKQNRQPKPSVAAWYVLYIKLYSVCSMVGLVTGQAAVTSPSFCTSTNERVYLTARACELPFGATRGLQAAGAGGL